MTAPASADSGKEDHQHLSAVSCILIFHGLFLILALVFLSWVFVFGVWYCINGVICSEAGPCQHQDRKKQEGVPRRGGELSPSRNSATCDILFWPFISLFHDGNISLCGNEVNRQRLTGDEQGKLVTAQSPCIQQQLIHWNMDFKKKSIYLKHHLSRNARSWYELSSSDRITSATGYYSSDSLPLSAAYFK